MSTSKLLQQIQIVFYAIMSGHIFAACLVVFILSPAMAFSPDNLIIGVNGVIAGLLILFAFMFYRQRIAAFNARELNDDEKLSMWRSAAIARWAIIDMVCFLQIILLYLSGNNFFLYCYVAGALAMMYTKPSPAAVHAELQLKEQL